MNERRYVQHPPRCQQHKKRLRIFSAHFDSQDFQPPPVRHALFCLILSCAARRYSVAKRAMPMCPKKNHKDVKITDKYSVLRKLLDRQRAFERRRPVLGARPNPGAHAARVENNRTHTRREGQTLATTPEPAHPHCCTHVTIPRRYNNHIRSTVHPIVLSKSVNQNLPKDKHLDSPTWCKCTHTRQTTKHQRKKGHPRKYGSGTPLTPSSRIANTAPALGCSMRC